MNQKFERIFMDLAKSMAAEQGVSSAIISLAITRFDSRVRHFDVALDALSRTNLLRTAPRRKGTRRGGGAYRRPRTEVGQSGLPPCRYAIRNF
jgi:hypothetical protein